MNLSDHIHGSEATVAHFWFDIDPEALPIVFTCASPRCHSTLWFEGLRIVRYGYATCTRCLVPMRELQGHTVH